MYITQIYIVYSHSKYSKGGWIPKCPTERPCGSESSYFNQKQNISQENSIFRSHFISPFCFLVVRPSNIPALRHFISCFNSFINRPTGYCIFREEIAINREMTGGQIDCRA